MGPSDGEWLNVEWAIRHENILPRIAQISTDAIRDVRFTLRRGRSAAELDLYNE